MQVKRVTLIGGTGFIGRAIARRLSKRGVRVRAVARGARTARELPAGVTPWRGHVCDRERMAEALADADAALYLPGRTHGRWRQDFETVHVTGARTCAEIAGKQGVSRFVYLSALGASAEAPAWSDQTKAEGEQAVSEAFPGASIVRPSLVLGAGDHFAGPMARRATAAPLLPVIGAETYVQPVYIDDLVKALVHMLEDDDSAGRVYQAAGPRRLRLIDLLRRIREAARARCAMVKLPYSVAWTLAAAVERLPSAPICRDQVRLMRTDKTADDNDPGLSDLGLQVTDPIDRLPGMVSDIVKR